MGGRFDNILGTIGNTPVIRINKLGPEGVNLYVKVESFNPMGSVKDRLALGLIEDAERRGELSPDRRSSKPRAAIRASALAMVCAQKGYPLVVTMAENFSVERRKLMRFLGARVVLTPGGQKGSGMVAKAAELAKAHGWWQPRQFENPANAEIHARTTAVEILEDFADVSLDYWVTGFGTGGTLNGVSRVLKEKSPHTQIIVCEPDNSAMLASGIAQPQARRRIPQREPSPLPAAPDAGLVPGLHPAARGAGHCGRSHRRLCADRRQGRAALRQGTRAAGRHLRRHLGGRHVFRCAAGRPRRAAGRQHPVHAARYRRTLPFHAAVRRRRHRDDRGGARTVEVDAGIPLRCRPGATGAGGSGACPGRSGRPRGRCHLARPGPACRHVRVRVVRVLRLGPQGVRGVRHRLHLDRSRFGRLPARRPRRQDTRGSQAPDRLGSPCPRSSSAATSKAAAPTCSTA